MTMVITVLEAHVAPERAADLRGVLMFEAAGAVPSLSVFDAMADLTPPASRN